MAEVLLPIDTPEQRRAIARSNRRALADRQHWPVGFLEACDQIAADHPHWVVTWSPGDSEPGFSAHRRSDDGPLPSFLRSARGATLAELLIDMAFLEEHVQAGRTREPLPPLIETGGR